MKRLIIPALLLAAYSSLLADQNQPPASAESHDAAAFLQQLDSLRKDANIPGMSVVVVKDHAIVLAAGLGYADVEEGIPATAETPYDIASVAKPLSAVVALRLVFIPAGMMAPTRLTNGEAAPYGLGWFVQEYEGHSLVWHSGWWEDAYSALYLKIPALNLTFIVLANSEGVWWNNPLDRAEVERSQFAQAFLSAFVDR